MSARRRPGRPLSGVGPERLEEWPDGDWMVRPVAGGDLAGKAYRCPGCDQEIMPGTPHVVAWPAWASAWGSGAGVEDRRHWHTACWRNRLRRGPQTPRRPRRAP